jgi:hypothetical protein
LNSHLQIHISCLAIAIHRRLCRMALKSSACFPWRKYSNGSITNLTRPLVNGGMQKWLTMLLQSVRKHDKLVSSRSRHSVSPLSEPQNYGEPEHALTKRSALFPVAERLFAIQLGIPSARKAFASPILHTVRLLMPTGTDVNDGKVSQLQDTR